jgi:RsiW-degrading membrane proteinase PrsW (M82 family)
VTVIADIVAVGVPLGFIAVVRRLDLYGSGGLRTVVACLLWGFVAFGLAYVLNVKVFFALFSALAVTVLLAPIGEEILKSLVLVPIVRRPDFTYIVDGAIYGFASGTGFAVLENLSYLSGRPDALAFAVSRVFSTSLMHGTASGLVGVTLGRFRFSRKSARLGSQVLGWAAAIGLHATYNFLVAEWPSWLPAALQVPLLWVIGLGGVGLMAFVIKRGLREEKAWLRERLGLEAGVATGESGLVQEMHQLSALLAPVEAHFGLEKRRLAERLLRREAIVGLRLEARARAHDERTRAELDRQVAELQAEVAGLQREIGVYCMGYVRMIIPPQGDPLWDALERSVAEAETREPTMNLWGTLDERADRGE